MNEQDAFKILLSALCRWEETTRAILATNNSYYYKGALDTIEAVRKAAKGLSDEIASYRGTT